MVLRSKRQAVGDIERGSGRNIRLEEGKREFVYRVKPRAVTA